MIDKAYAAMSADRNDRLVYYNALSAFYGNQAITATGEKSTAMENQQKVVNSQIALIENDLAQSQANVQYIKEQMMNPETAKIYGAAGVTLNDTPQQIQQKIAQYSYVKEMQDTSNAMAADGYTYLSPTSKAPAGAEVVSMSFTNPFTGKVTTNQYYKVPKTTSSGSNLLSVTEAKALGVPYGTTQEEAYGLNVVKNLSETKIANIADFNTTISAWNNVSELAKQVEQLIGPYKIQSYKGTLSNLMSQYKYPELQVLKAEVEKAFQLYRKETTGAQASDRELQMLRPLLPSLTDSPAVFFGKIEQTIAGTQRAMNALLDAYSLAGYDVDAYYDKGGQGGQEYTQEDLDYVNSLNLK